MRLVPYALLRAPLLPASALATSTDDALLDEAIELASPTLARHADARGDSRRDRYRRRAAFRATPSGLLAGVAVVELGARTTLVLGGPRRALTVPFARLASLGRALLDNERWQDAQVRAAPSLLRGEDRVSWLGYGTDGRAVSRQLAIDPLLASVLDAVTDWVPAPRLARAIGDDGRALVLRMVDDGLLHHDLEPPLVGAPPLQWMAERVPALTGLEQALAVETIPALRERIAALPGSGDALTGVLVHDAHGAVARGPIERAAALAPALFALQAALSPPLEEVVPGLAEVLARASALVGEGVVTLSDVELGRLGVSLGDPTQPPSPRLDVASWLAGLVVEAAREGREVLALDRASLQARCGAAPCDTFEVHLAPSDGDDWLLGLHAPAGSSWGRFAHALGEPMTRALGALREAEQAVDGEVLRADLAFAPTRELADLCCVPSLREAAVAVSSWPDGPAIPLEPCAIVNEPAGPLHGALTLGDARVRVSPLHRVRSTTAPPSAGRIVAADALRRQHAPWLLTWGPLAALPWLPRVMVDGFVIAPQSWALPASLDDEAIASWRKEAKVARVVQAGAEDVLLPLDLDLAADRAQLRELGVMRVSEIWPPLGRELDRDGRRVELVCAVVDEDCAPRPLPPHLLPTRSPLDEPPAPGWRTVRLYAPLPHDELFADVVRFADAKAEGVFVLRYRDDTGEHLRVRLRGRDDGAAARLAAALVRALGARLVTSDIAPYQPERGRWGPALPAVERIFESDTRWVADCLASELPREALLVLGFDALARGCLRAAEVEDLAEEALAAYGIDVAEEREQLAPAYRAVQQPLAALLADPPASAREHRARVKAARLGQRARTLLPALLHLSAVRLIGPDRDAEVVALYRWVRALRSKRARG